MTPAQPQPASDVNQDDALKVACETAHQYPSAVYSKPCSFPECELSCKGREHRLSAQRVLALGFIRLPDDESLALALCQIDVDQSPPWTFESLWRTNAKEYRLIAKALRAWLEGK